MIYRAITNSIRDSLKSYPVILLNGVRYSGKTCLLENSIKGSTYSYVNLDNKIELANAKSDPSIFLKSHKTPLIIDEVQKAPELLVHIKNSINYHDSNCQFILSCSYRNDAIDELLNSLGDKIKTFDLMNLSFNEIVKRQSYPFDTSIVEYLTNRIDDYKLSETEIFKYILKGFFPLLYEDEKISLSSFYSSLISDYFEKDLKDLIDIKDETKFINFLKSLASNTGEELVYDYYAREIKVSTNTIKAWVKILFKTNIIYLLEPYQDDSIERRLVKRPKMYFSDTGLAAYLCGINNAEALQNSYLNERFFETYAFNEIRKSHLNSGLNTQLFYYRDSNQNEIDLIVIKNYMISLIDFKLEKSIDNSLTRKFKIFNNIKLIKKNNVILSTSNELSRLDDGTYIVPVVEI